MNSLELERYKQRDSKVTEFVNGWGLEGIPLLAFGSTANIIEDAIDSLLVDLSYLDSILSNLNVSDTTPFIEETLKFINKERDVQ